MARIVLLVPLLAPALAQALGQPTAQQELPVWALWAGLGIALAVAIAAMVWMKRPVKEVNRRRKSD